jgi:hypothetical protein
MVHHAVQPESDYCAHAFTLYSGAVWHVQKSLTRTGCAQGVCVHTKDYVLPSWPGSCHSCAQQNIATVKFVCKPGYPMTDSNSIDNMMGQIWPTCRPSVLAVAAVKTRGSSEQGTRLACLHSIALIYSRYLTSYLTLVVSQSVIIRS